MNGYIHKLYSTELIIYICQHEYISKQIGKACLEKFLVCHHCKFLIHKTVLYMNLWTHICINDNNDMEWKNVHQLYRRKGKEGTGI